LPSLLVTPSLDKTIVQRRGIVTVPNELAKAACRCPGPCNGISINTLPLPLRPLEIHLRQMGDRFIDRMRVRGFEWVGGDLRLHGPWVSYEFNQHVADVESAAWREAERSEDPSAILPFVFEQDAASPYSDYLLVGQFITTPVLTEIIVKEDE